MFAAQSLYFSGEIAQLARRHATVLADAEDRGDLYMAVNLATTTTIAIHLAADDPDAARRGVRKAMKQWSQTGFLVQHFQAMAFEPDIDLYVGDVEAAYQRFAREWPALVGSLLLKVQFIRAIVYFARGRYAAASADRGSALGRARLAEARRAARKLEREGMAWTGVLTRMVRAAAANAAGDADGARTELRAAVAEADAAGMAMHAAAARLRLGQVVAGAEGEALTKAAIDAIAAEGVRDPARWAGIYLPGRWVPR